MEGVETNTQTMRFVCSFKKKKCKGVPTHLTLRGKITIGDHPAVKKDFTDDTSMPHQIWRALDWVDKSEVEVEQQKKELQECGAVVEVRLQGGLLDERGVCTLVLHGASLECVDLLETHIYNKRLKRTTSSCKGNALRRCNLCH